MNHLIHVGGEVIDSDLRDLIKVILFSHSFKPYLVHIGDKIAQLISYKIETPIFVECDYLTWTERSSKGFGSSGV